MLPFVKVRQRPNNSKPWLRIVLRLSPIPLQFPHMRLIGPCWKVQSRNSPLVDSCRATFAPAVEAVVRPVPLELHYTADEWRHHLSRAKIGKAAPQCSAPSTAWKICASVVSPFLSRATSLLHATTQDLCGPLGQILNSYGWPNPTSRQTSRLICDPSG